MSFGKILLAIVGVLVVFAIIVALSISGIFNRLVTLRQATDAAWAQVENVYQRRADLVPNLVNTVAGAANFEKSTLEEITAARASVGRVQLPAGGALSRLLVVSERYPTLTATAGFRDLQAQLEGTENRISVERGRFNEAVQAYNTALQRFPAVIFAGMFGHTARPYFTATAGSDKPPAVQFDFGTKTVPAKP